MQFKIFFKSGIVIAMGNLNAKEIPDNTLLSHVMENSGVDADCGNAEADR